MKHRLTDHSGYLIIDHSSSPGISEDEIPDRLRTSAIATPEGTISERDIQFCTHCQRSIILNPLRERPRGYCPKCDHYICDSCYSIYSKSFECIPVKKVLDTLEKGG